MIRINETNVTIMVKSMDASIAFYESIGFSLKNRWDNHYAMLETTGMTIGLHPDDGESQAGNKISLGLMIDKAEEAKALLDKLGINYEYADGKSGIYLHFEDPDGTVLYFTQPKWR